MAADRSVVLHREGGGHALGSQPLHPKRDPCKSTNNTTRRANRKTAQNCATITDMTTHASKELNADPAELAKFSALAHRWWDKTGEFKPLHAINPLRLDWIDQLASLSGKQVLDIGCGGGILADSMARRGANVLGIDLASKALKVAQLHALEAQTPRISYREVSAEALALEQPGQYDIVTCMEMLEHVPDPASVVQACSKLVKPGGWVFFSTINRNPKAYVFAVLGAEYLLNMLPRGTHDYAKFIRPSELTRDVRQAGLEQRELRGLEHNPLTGRYWLSQDTSVNYLLATQRSA
jgi:2-polyprenyl-6-hydroxyphenyl methylase / 3-demethylubiquinone-9 3-methyltransferase